jgi:hypothetical protein
LRTIEDPNEYREMLTVAGLQAPEPQRPRPPRPTPAKPTAESDASVDHRGT